VDNVFEGLELKDLNLTWEVEVFVSR